MLENRQKVNLKLSIFLNFTGFYRLAEWLFFRHVFFCPETFVLQAHPDSIRKATGPFRAGGLKILLSPAQAD